MLAGRGHGDRTCQLVHAMAVWGAGDTIGFAGPFLVLQGSAVPNFI